MLVRDIMTEKVVTVSPETPVRDIARLLVEHRISAVPVLDALQHLVGIVSEGDLLHRVEVGTEPHAHWWSALVGGGDADAAAYVKSHGRRAADVMTRNVVTAREEMMLPKLAALLERKRIKRVPIMRGRRLVGIVSRSDVVRAMIAAAPADAIMPLPLGDDAIRGTLLAALAAEPWAEPHRLNVVVRRGTVELWGLVGSEDEREAYGIVAESIPGVRGVRNNCAVAGTLGAAV